MATIQVTVCDYCGNKPAVGTCPNCGYNFCVADSYRIQTPRGMAYICKNSTCLTMFVLTPISASEPQQANKITMATPSVPAAAAITAAPATA